MYIVELSRRDNGLVRWSHVVSMAMAFQCTYVIYKMAVSDEPATTRLRGQPPRGRPHSAALS